MCEANLLPGIRAFTLCATCGTVFEPVKWDRPYPTCPECRRLEVEAAQEAPDPEGPGVTSECLG